MKSAIDNATRGLIGLGQLPVTCGLFFSLGHSTIVIIIVSIPSYETLFMINNSEKTIAIAISAHVYNNLTGVGNVGGIIGIYCFCSEMSADSKLYTGSAVSGSFLFIIGLANTIILCKIMKRRRRVG